MLNKDIESFYKLIVENKQVHAITPSKRKKQINPQQRYFSGGNIAIKNPSIFYCIFTKESWNNYNALFSQESAALSQLSHTDPDKID